MYTCGSKVTPVRSFESVAHQPLAWKVAHRLALLSLWHFLFWFCLFTLSSVKREEDLKPQKKKKKKLSGKAVQVFGVHRYVTFDGISSSPQNR